MTLAQRKKHKTVKLKSLNAVFRSHEDSYGDGSSAARSEAEGQGDTGLPDSQVARHKNLDE